MKISQILFTMVVLGSVFSYVHFIDNSIDTSVKIASDRVGA